MTSITCGSNVDHVLTRAAAAGVAAVLVSVALGACSDDEEPTSASDVAPSTSSTSASAGGIESVVANREADEPGCAVGVADEGESEIAVFGLADVESARPIDETTLFDIGSVSKQFTASVVLGLVDDGVLTPADTVASWLPDVTGPAGDVTIEQLLHHRSGIPDYTNRLLQNGLSLESEATQADAIESVAVTPLDFAPGSRFSYSNTNYVLLAEIAQRAGGEPFVDLVAARVLEPAGMSTAFVHDYSATPAPMATSYEPGPGDDFVALIWRWTQVGDGAIHASVTDMLAWGRYLLEPQSSTPLVSRLAAGSEPVSDGNLDSYGAGVFVTELEGRPVVEHRGEWQGFVTYFAVVPDDGLTVTALCNRTDADPRRLAVDALDAWSA